MKSQGEYSSEEVGVNFDEDFNVRIFDKEKMESSEDLRVQTNEFVKKLTQFKGHLSKVLEIIESQRDLIEQEKMRAIGIRNLVKEEVDTRVMKKKELQRSLAEKNELMERYNEELSHLQKVENQQKHIIERLSNNEAVGEFDN